MIAPPLSLAMDKPEWLTNMETVLEVLNEGVIIADDRQRILFANSQLVEMTGIPRKALIGFASSSFYTSQEMDFLRQQIDIAFQAGHNRYAFVLPRKGGGRLPVIISSRRLENSRGKFGIVTFTDISEQLRAEEELRSANVKLQNRQLQIEDDLRLAAPFQNSLPPSSLLVRTLGMLAVYHTLPS